MGSGAVYPEEISITKRQVPDLYMVRHEVTLRNMHLVIAAFLSM
jgi:hypothetical protein